MAVSKEAFGYLDRSIQKPPNLLADTASSTETPWGSEIPSPKKWRVCGT